MRNTTRNALATILALRQRIILIKPEVPMSQGEIDAETERLNALPADQQLIVFCQAMGWSVCEYLHEKAKFNGEIARDHDHVDSAVDYQPEGM
jgi:hypothetical protein